MKQYLLLAQNEFVYRKNARFFSGKLLKVMRCHLQRLFLSTPFDSINTSSAILKTQSNKQSMKLINRSIK